MADRSSLSSQDAYTAAHTTVAAEVTDLPFTLHSAKDT
jgi:hypothetical protein